MNSYFQDTRSMWALTVFAAALFATSAPAEETDVSAFRLGPGDRLAVSVWQQPDLSMELPVAPDGTISYLLVGTLKAAGLTIGELEAELGKELQKHVRDPQVSVTLLDVQSYRIYVVGEVLRPGEFAVKGPVNVVQALAMASGFTPFAARRKVLIVGPPQSGRPVRTFDYERFVEDLGTTEDFALSPGDTVVVQ